MLAAALRKHSQIACSDLGAYVYVVYTVVFQPSEEAAL